MVSISQLGDFLAEDDLWYVGSRPSEGDSFSIECICQEYVGRNDLRRM